MKNDNENAEPMDLEEPPMTQGQSSITNYFSGFSGKHTIKGGNKKRKHPQSLLRDETLPIRDLEAHESIFDIIMPWRKEQQEEDDKKKGIKRILEKKEKFT